MHLVVGERVFPQIQELGQQSSVYGAFLLGCVLVDVTMIAPLDRRRTHFSDGLHGQGGWAFDRSCENMLAQLDDVLLRPWRDLSGRERAFVAGYVCHLAADESWKAFSLRLLHKLGLTRLSELPVPGGVLMTVYQIASTALFADLPAIDSAVASAEIPDVLRYIPHHVLAQTWAVAGPHALDGRTPESFYAMVARMGRTEAKVQAVRENHERHWEAALAFVAEQEDVASIVASGVDRSLEVIPRLWQE